MPFTATRRGAELGGLVNEVTIGGAARVVELLEEYLRGAEADGP